MNNRERFFNFVQGKPVDYRPWGAVLSLYGAKLTKCPVERYYNDPASYALGQEAVCESIDPGFVMGSFILSGYANAFGAELKYIENYPPNVLRTPISSADEIRKLSIPDVNNNPSLFYMRETLRRVSAAHRNDRVIVEVILSPIDLPMLIMGLDAWMRTVLTDEAGVRRMLDITLPFFIQLCEAYFSDGADALIIPLPFLTKDITTSHIVKTFAMPLLQEAFSKLGGPVVLHHVGSSIFDFVDVLDTLPNILGLCMSAEDNLTEARERIRPESILFGGLDGPTLDTHSADEVRSKTGAFLANVKNDKKLVPFLVGTDTSINTPLENILAFRNTVREFNE